MLIMPSKKPPLTLIYTPEWKFRELVEYGLWHRERELLCWYAEQFDLDVYSCDGQESAALLADLPLHYRPVPWMINRFGLRHVCFFLWLLVHTLTHRGVVRGIGIDLPILALVKLIARRPVIVSFQYDWGVIWKNLGQPWGWIASIFQKMTLWSADVVIATTERLRETCEQKYHCRRVVVIPNFVNVEQFAPACERDATILYAGRLNRDKCIDVLLQAFEQIAADFPAYRLIIVGRGEEHEALQTLAASLSAANRIEILGGIPHPQVAALMTKATAFVYPSKSEGHPKALIEAMASGCTCIATNVVGNKDVISAELDGLLLPVRDVDALAAALRRVLSDPALRQRLSAAAVQSAQQYSRERVLAREKQLILSLQSAHTRL